jgi:hypothetical protein
MLLPFEFAIISKDEITTLMDFIRRMTETKTIKENYPKMEKLGILELYEKLRQFMYSSNHYHNELQYFDTISLKRDENV